MNKNKILKLLCSRLGQLKSIGEIDYPRIEELSHLILTIIQDKEIK